MHWVQVSWLQGMISGSLTIIFYEIFSRVIRKFIK